MSMFQKITAYIIRFLAKPIKWLAGLLFFLLLFLFVIFLFTGNSWVEFVNGVTLALGAGALGAIIIHIVLTDYSEKLMRNERSLPTFQQPELPIMTHSTPKTKRKRRKKSKQATQSGNVINMSDYR